MVRRIFQNLEHQKMGYGSDALKSLTVLHAGCGFTVNTAYVSNYQKSVSSHY